MELQCQDLSGSRGAANRGVTGAVGIRPIGLPLSSYLVHQILWCPSLRLWAVRAVSRLPRRTEPRRSVGSCYKLGDRLSGNTGIYTARYFG